MKAYYHARAAEYDDWWRGRGLFAGRDRPGWEDELAALTALLAGLPPARTLDVACGTGFLTRHLPGEVVGLDQSESMLELARSQALRATFVRGDALALPFADASFDRLFSSFFYCHLEEPERSRFLAEARRVGGELIIVAAVLRDEAETERWEERTLADGSNWKVYKRYFSGAALADEVGGGKVLFERNWFVVVRSP